MGEPTQDLAGFAATLSCDAIPERVRTHCKNVLLDTIACAVAGHQGEETGQIAALAGGPQRLTTMAAAARSLGRLDAAARLADLVLDVAAVARP